MQIGLKKSILADTQDECKSLISSVEEQRHHSGGFSAAAKQDVKVCSHLYMRPDYSNSVEDLLQILQKVTKSRSKSAANRLSPLKPVSTACGLIISILLEEAHFSLCKTGVQA